MAERRLRKAHNSATGETVLVDAATGQPVANGTGRPGQPVVNGLSVRDLDNPAKRGAIGEAIRSARTLPDGHGIARDAAESHEPTVPPVPMLTRRVVTVDLGEKTGVPEYNGHTFDLWVNPPGTHADDLKSGDHERVMGALKRVILRHNGWLDYPDEDGNRAPLPQPSDDAFWAKIPGELMTLIIYVEAQARADAPLSLLRGLTPSSPTSEPKTSEGSPNDSRPNTGEPS